MQVAGNMKGEYVCVYRNGERVEKYARTEKNSKRLAADLEVCVCVCVCVCVGLYRYAYIEDIHIYKGYT